MSGGGCGEWIYRSFGTGPWPCGGDTAPAPDAADPADTQEQALARMIGSAESVTLKLEWSPPGC